MTFFILLFLDFSAHNITHNMSIKKIPFDLLKEKALENGYLDLDNVFTAFEALEIVEYQIEESEHLKIKCLEAGDISYSKLRMFIYPQNASYFDGEYGTIRVYKGKLLSIGRKVGEEDLEIVTKLMEELDQEIYSKKEVDLTQTIECTQLYKSSEEDLKESPSSEQIISKPTKLSDTYSLDETSSDLDNNNETSSNSEDDDFQLIIPTNPITKDSKKELLNAFLGCLDLCSDLTNKSNVPIRVVRVPFVSDEGKPENHGKKWLPSDEFNLLKLVQTKENWPGIQKVAKDFGRTEISIKLNLFKLASVALCDKNELDGLKDSHDFEVAFNNFGLNNADFSIEEFKEFVLKRHQQRILSDKKREEREAKRKDTPTKLQKRKLRVGDIVEFEVDGKKVDAEVRQIISTTSAMIKITGNTDHLHFYKKDQIYPVKRKNLKVIHANC